MADQNMLNPEKIISNGKIVVNEWEIILNPVLPAPNTNIIVPLYFWFDQQNQFQTKNNIGIWLTADEAGAALEKPELLRSMITRPVIGVKFPEDEDHRPFQLARALRKQGYEGELRAFGHLVDHSNPSWTTSTWAARNSFNSFVFDENVNLQTALDKISALAGSGWKSSSQ